MSKMKTDEEILSSLSLSGKRLSHTIAVAEECDSLAKLFRLDGKTAGKLHLAALLHDMTKELKPAEQMKLCDKLKIDYSTNDIESPKVFHAMTAAALAAEKYHADDEVCLYIRSHTTGSSAMTLGEKLLYLADYIEKTRTFPDCVELRRIFYAAVEENKKSLDDILNDILILSFDMTIRNLMDEGAFIHPATIKARNSLIRIRNAGQTAAEVPPLTRP